MAKSNSSLVRSQRAKIRNFCDCFKDLQIDRVSNWSRFPYKHWQLPLWLLLFSSSFPKSACPNTSSPSALCVGSDFRSHLVGILLVFSVTLFKNRSKSKNQNCSIDQVKNLGNERRYIYKDPRQDSGQRNISYTRYPKKCFTQTYRDLFGDAMLVLT